MIGRCVRCANISYSERPDMYFCRERGTLVNIKFADNYHECFVPRTAEEGSA